MPQSVIERSHRRTLADRVDIDFPKQNEVIDSECYTLRIRATGHVKRAEVSFDDGPWQSCRESLGFRWYDWSGYEDGEHEVVARIETTSGRTINSEPHEFFVSFSQR